MLKRILVLSNQVETIMTRILIIALIPFILGSCKRNSNEYFIRELDKDWMIQSSEKVNCFGEIISLSDFNPSGWIKCEVPSTVFTALYEAGYYDSIYYNNNLEKISTEPFGSSWWYRTEFYSETSSNDQNYILKLYGINYRSDIWFNGEKIASADTTENPYRIYNLEISKFIRKGKNVIAVEVFPPEKTDLTIGFVDWNPVAPDKNMGIWRKVELICSGSITLIDPHVNCKVDTSSQKTAELFIDCAVKTIHPQKKQ